MEETQVSGSFFFFFFFQKFGKGEGVNLILCKWKILRDEGLQLKFPPWWGST